MGAVFYKVLFAVELHHQSAPGKPAAAFGLEPTELCKKTLRNYRLEYRAEPGKISVYHSGNVVIENEDPLESKILPNPALPDNTEFVFVVTLLDQSIINKTVIPGKSAIDITNHAVAIPQSFIKPSIVAIRFKETASTKPYETFKVLNSKNQVVLQSLAVKDEEGYYNCTADLSLQSPGIYSFALEGDNSLTEKFYVDAERESSGHYGIIRIVKDNTWLIPDKLMPAPAMPDYNVFNYTFIKTP